ncbi:AlkZ-related protein [Pseudoneobacillus sp. C159]
MKKYQINTYEEAIEVIQELGILPLANLTPHYPSLESMTAKENWHSGTLMDPWLWRAKFPVDGVAAYGKFLKKKSILISRKWLPFVFTVIGNNDSIEERYSNGLVSREALELYKIIHEEEGIDTRVLRVKAGMKDKDKKKPFDQALVELQANMDIVVSGTKAKTNEFGEVNGWSSTAFETIENWAGRNKVSLGNIRVEMAKNELKAHFEKNSHPEAMKFFTKLFKL